MGSNPRGALALFQQALEKDGQYIDALIQAGYVSGNTLNRFAESLAYLGRADQDLQGKAGSRIRPNTPIST